MKIFRVILAIIGITSILFTTFYGRYKISEEHLYEQDNGYRGIITIWHIDSFEGGVGSRKQFLLKVAKSFERKHSGVLVMVIEHTIQSYTKALSEGYLPDMLSYGNGVESANFSKIDSDKTFQGGTIGNIQYALPWCRGGYSIIANPELASDFPTHYEQLLISQAQYTQPLLALYLEGLSVREPIVKSPMDAYVQFVSGKTPYFLGTQRDINRLETRGMQVVSKPLTKFNDLNQYISITTKDELKRFYANEFICYLLTSQVQDSLKDIGMLSCYQNVLFTNEHLSAMQNASNFQSISVFTPHEILSQLQVDSARALKGDKESINKIQKMLI